MKKIVYVVAAGLLALSTTACQSAAEKYCDKTDECLGIVCDAIEDQEVLGVNLHTTCVETQEKANETCLKNAEEYNNKLKDASDDCADASDKYLSCQIDSVKCDATEGVVIDEDACDSELDAVSKACGESEE